MRRESIAFTKQVDANKLNLETIIADKNRNLIDLKAENLILKDQLEEQGLQFAQYHARSAITKDLIEELRHAIASVKTVQEANQAMLGKYSMQVLCARQEYLQLKTVNDELELHIAAKTSNIESYERKIRELEELKITAEVRGSRESEATRTMIEDCVSGFRQHIDDMRQRSKQHIDELYKLASFANTELKRVLNQNFVQSIMPESVLQNLNNAVNTDQPDLSEPRAAVSTDLPLQSKPPEADLNTVKSILLEKPAPPCDPIIECNGKECLAEPLNGDPNDIVLNVSGLFPILPGKS